MDRSPIRFRPIELIEAFRIENAGESPIDIARMRSYSSEETVGLSIFEWNVDWSQFREAYCRLAHVRGCSYESTSGHLQDPIIESRKLDINVRYDHARDP